MRTKEALRNVVCSFGSYFLTLITGFIAQRVFSDSLGKEYLGLHSLFMNLMTMLGIAEMGFGTAIVSNMYKPVAENDTKSIIGLLQYYKKMYEVIATIIIVVGICLIPFLKYIVGENEIEANLSFIFLFYLADTVVSYFATYKRSIIYANQKAYYTNSIHAFLVVVMNIAQIVLLRATGNFYFYLIIKVVFRILENICINILANRKYPYIVTNEKIVVNQTVQREITNKVKGLLFHKLGAFAVFGSDNIIISMLPNLGLIAVGIYSNYLMITNQLKNIIAQAFAAITASIGSLLIENDKKKSYEVFRRLLLINAWLDIYTSVSFYFISFPFIEIWMGESFLLSGNTVMVIAVYLFISELRVALGTFKEAAGIFYEDRYVPVGEAIINILASILLGYFYGIAGVVVGTICSDLLLLLYSYPKYVYGKIFCLGYLKYVRDLSGYIVQFMVVFGVSQFIIDYIVIDGLVEQIVSNFLMCLLVSNIVMLILNCRKTEFKELCSALMTYARKNK